MSGEDEKPDDPVQRDPVQEELLTRLHGVGLCSEYWLPKLRDKLGVTSLQALKHLQYEDYLKLECEVEHPWEKRALQQLLKLRGSKTTMKQLQEERLERLQKKQEKAKLALEELKEMQESGRSRHEEEVKCKEERLWQAMDVPREYWVSSEKPLVEVIENMQKQLNLLEESVSKGENIPDEEVLRWASGGLALQGIYRTDKLEDLLEKREPLITVPDGFKLSGPEQGPLFEKKEFSSSRTESTFTKTMEKLGFSISVAAKGGFWGFSAETSTDYSTASEHEDTHRSRSEHTYICTAKYNYIPLASCYFPKDQLRLSNAALQELTGIEQLLSHTPEPDRLEMLKSRYGGFFTRFGSHVNQGPLHFGGIFWWKASSEGFRAERLDEVKKQTSDALNSYVGGSFTGFGFSAAVGVNVSKSNSAASFQGTVRENQETKIQLFVTKTGGPPDVDGLAQWKSELVINNQTWCIIDRGFQLIPVWDIILANHRQDFADVHQVSNSLRAAYTALTNQSTSPLFGEGLISAVEEAKAFLEDLKTWHVTGDEEQLLKLMDFKQKLNERTKNYSVWISVCLSHKGLQDFLEKTVSLCRELPEQNTFSIRSQLRCLLDPHVYSVKNFPRSSLVMQWVFHTEDASPNPVSVSDFPALTETLQQMKSYIQEVTYEPLSSAAAVQEAKVKATTHVSLALSSLLEGLRERAQTDTELLLLSIAASTGYQVESHTFQHLLGSPDINFMLREMQTAHEEYLTLRDGDVYRAQAFLLLTCLTITPKSRDVSPEQKSKRLAFLEGRMGDSWCPELTSVLRKYRACRDWEGLGRDLNSLIEGELEATNDDMKKQIIIKEMEEIFQGRKPSNLPNSKPLVKSSSGQMQETTENQAFLNLLKRLGLASYYPQKMGRADFHIIYKTSVHDSQPSKDSELPFYFLQKLMMLDYRVRYLVCKDDTKTEQDPANAPTTQGNEDESSDTFDDFFNDFSEEASESAVSQTHVHPMDIQMAIFHCADDFMRQYVCTKLALCQFALPLLVPSPHGSQIQFPLWALSQLQKSWKGAEKSGVDTRTKNNKNKLIYQVDTPVVSFMRIGDSPASSKSQILNALLSKHKHNIFFHRHCRGSSQDCLLMRGVVEIFWYCPGGRDDDRFDNCIAFTNLHGDAREHEQQIQFLQEVSSINVLLITESGQNDKKSMKIIHDLWQSKKPLICLLADKEKVVAGRSTQNIKIALKNRNEAELIDELTTTITHLLAGSHRTVSLEACGEIARQHGFLIDEDKEECKEAKAVAQTLVTLLKENKLRDIKEKLLPLQGELWHKWCRKDKELTRLQDKRNRSIEQHRSKIESEKSVIRNKQLKRAFPLNDLMRSMLEFLQTHPEATKKYFLQWMKVFMDDLSSDRLAVLQQDYHKLWSQILVLKKKGVDDGLKNKLLRELEALSNEINDSTIGLEHILREVGQIYEALEAMNERDKCFHELPQIAADLMVSGYPVELMDGDASYVPLKWVGAVFDRLIEKLGDKKVFVLSVLGIQSTGKSTLLNAMFGLQFNVSAGRCTRGAFMQLIKVDEKLQQDLHFDYLFVVDTEGLRAMELANKMSLNHDNELATFVIGIGNMTLINIFGENPSEMQDILQIAVQAFLRMKQVRLSPGCLFVHQNVGEITAKEQNMEGQRRLQEKLDEMTVTAAQQEFCDATCFNDVIRFDVNSHIHYFAHLWEGNPPMAPPNPRYSQNVQDLKNSILMTSKQESQGSVLKLSGLKDRISDLWSALLNENFIFSFKNSLEIATYKKLEVMYGQWTWQLRSHILDLETKLSNRIRNGDMLQVRHGNLEEQVQEKYSAIMKEFEKYFSEDKDSEMLIRWKGGIELKLKDLRESLVAETKKKCEKLIELKKNQSKLDEKKSEYENELFKRSKDLALSLKGKELSESELRRSFNSLWTGWVTEVSSAAPPAEEPDIDVDLENILLERFKQPYLAGRIKDFSRKNKFSVVFSKHICTKTKMYIWKTSLDECDKRNIQQITDNIIYLVKEKIDQKEQQKRDYNRGYFHEILNEIRRGTNSLSSTSKYTFNKEYEIDLSLYLCKRAAQRFEDMHAVFKKANDPALYLESKREDFFKCFQISCQGATSITTLADFLCAKLSAALPQAVYDKTAIDIASEMRANYPAFNGNRSKLEAYVLKSLAEEENFDKYRQYIHFPKDFIESFIKKCVGDYSLDKKNPRLKTVLSISLDALHSRVVSAIDDSTRVVKDRRGDVSSWLDEFCSRLGGDLCFPRSDLKSIEHQEITDIEFLKKAMNKALDPVTEKLRKDFAVTDLHSLRKEPHKILAEQLGGCWEQCPFCSAACTNTIANHDGAHTVSFHHPQAVRGVSWHRTNHLVTDICSSLVASDCNLIISDSREYPYKRYRDAGHPYNTWNITPDTSVLPYWKWFVCRFREDLEKQYSKKFEGKGEIPYQWKTITKTAVLSELEVFLK